MDVMIREFGRYVADRHRTELFRRAIAEQVRHGDVVVDLGTGFGLLALLAVRQGARHVYAIEQAQYIDLARGIAADNGVADLITFLHGNSGGIELPERADCLIAELLGQYALEEYLVEYVHDAAQRFLKPGARVAPSAVTLRLAPVDMPGVRERLAGRLSEPWTGVAGFDFRRLQRAVAANDLSPYLVELFGSRRIAIASFTPPSNSPSSATACWTASSGPSTRCSRPPCCSPRVSISRRRTGSRCSFRYFPRARSAPAIGSEWRSAFWRAVAGVTGWRRLTVRSLEQPHAGDDNRKVCSLVWSKYIKKAIAWIDKHLG